MKKLAVIYDTGHGHTEHIARLVTQAAGDVIGTPGGPACHSPEAPDH